MHLISSRPNCITMKNEISKRPPLASIVIPCYNGEKFLREAINSAANQTYPYKEIIVINDGSTDDSFKIMESYGQNISIINQKNAGLSAARNAGITKARGDYYAFLDADDYWDNDFLSNMISALKGSTNAIAYCGWQNVGLSGPRGEPFIPPDYEAMPNKKETLYTGVRWPVHAALISRQILYEAGLFNPSLRSCEDFALWIRAATRHTLVLVPKVLAYYRFHDNQMTGNRERIALSRLEVQQTFFRENPELVSQLGKKIVRSMTFGELLKLGYIAYWQRDLPASRSIFRRVMRGGYGNLRDWKYMLPSILPLPIHRWLIHTLERTPYQSSTD